MRRGILGLALCLVLTGGGQAEAATTFGSNLTVSAGSTVALSGQDYTTASRAIPAGRQAPGGVSAPINGVVVRWRIRSAANTATPAGQSWQARFRLLQGNHAVGTSTSVLVADIDGVQTFDTRLPVHTGDAIGLDTPGGEGYVVVNDANGNVDFYTPVLGGDETRNPTYVQNPFFLNVNADIEADADGDGFGDETQDQCPTNAATKGGPCPDTDGDGTFDTADQCPAVSGPASNKGCPLPDAVAPDTTITKKPTAKTKSKQVRLEFSSSAIEATFECSFDGSPFAACVSPVLRNLGKGTHVFQVRAKDAAGNVDPSPAVAEWKVVKKKKKKPRGGSGNGGR